MEETKDPDIKLWEEINNLQSPKAPRDKKKLRKLAANSTHFERCMGSDTHGMNEEDFSEKLAEYISEHMQEGMNQKTQRILENSNEEMKKLARAEQDLKQAKQFLNKL